MGGFGGLELRLTSAKVEVEVEAELGKNIFSFDWVSNWWLLLVHLEILQEEKTKG